MRVIASLLVLIFLSGCSVSAKEKFANSFSEFRSGVADTFTADEQRVQIENVKKEVDAKLLALQQENEKLSLALALEQEKVKKMEDDKSCKKKKNKK